jgi:hypothetical protein
MALGLTKEDRINTVYGGGGHVVILGAGASIAATIRNPLKDGRELPAMNNFIKVVGLDDIVKRVPKNLRSRNFETLFSNLYENSPDSSIIKEIEQRIYHYFSDMKLPEEATIYDYLILSLRSRDIIATFNWDPFLYQAFERNRHIGQPPYIAFLHGSVALGYSAADKRSGAVGYYSKKTKARFEPTKLLYPITKKNYTDDEFIKSQWDMLNSFLSDKVVKRLTIFGYGAPSSDIEAMQLMNKAWGTGQDRSDEQVEIIDIRPEDKVMKQWKNFIYSGHTDFSTNYFSSSLSTNPRRTFESYHQHNFPLTPAEAFSDSNPVPKDFKILAELQNWHRPLIDAENKALNKTE